MTTKPEAFEQILKQETNLLSSLKELMLEEKLSVESNEIDNLVLIAERKKNLLDLLESASKTRNEFLLAAVQAPTPEQRMRQYVKQSEPKYADKLESLVNELELTLHECKRQNSENAMIISMNQRNVERNMNILKGTDNNSMTYTQSGSTNTTSRTISGLKA